MRIAWAPAEPPLPATAVAVQVPAAARLEAKIDRNPQWRVTRFDSWTVVRGAELPWVDGAIYLGELPGATRVLVPVHHRPLVHPDLVHRAAATFRGTAQSIALLPGSDGVAVLPLADP